MSSTPAGGISPRRRQSNGLSHGGIETLGTQRIQLGTRRAFCFCGWRRGELLVVLPYRRLWGKQFKRGTRWLALSRQQVSDQCLLGWFSLVFFFFLVDLKPSPHSRDGDAGLSRYGADRLGSIRAQSMLPSADIPFDNTALGMTRLRTHRRLRP